MCTAKMHSTHYIIMLAGAAYLSFKTTVDILKGQTVEGLTEAMICIL